MYVLMIDEDNIAIFPVDFLLVFIMIAFYSIPRYWYKSDEKW